MCQKVPPMTSPSAAACSLSVANSVRAVAGHRAHKLGNEHIVLSLSPRLGAAPTGAVTHGQKIRVQR